MASLFLPIFAAAIMALLDFVRPVITLPALTVVCGSVVLFTIYAIVHTSFVRRLPPNAPPEVRGNYPITGAWAYWKQRWDWYRQCVSESKTGNFSFHAGPNTVIALSGDQGRQLFFESKHLGFLEAYGVLFGEVVTLDENDGQNQYNVFNRRMKHLLKKEQLQRRLPTLISDVREAMEAIQREPNCVTNPFESLYRAVFKLTIRMIGAEDIANDPKILAETLTHFEMIDKSSNAMTVMFPKFLWPALLKRTYAGGRLYLLFDGIIKKRAASGEKCDDTLQYMLDQGDSTARIVRFIVGSLYAALVNSGINTAWVMTYLASSPEWLAKAKEEIRNTAAKYAWDPDMPLRRQLDNVPLEAWEEEFPILEMCLRDSIRLNLIGTVLRKNVSDRAIPIGDGKEVIPPGALVMYGIGDIHLDPETYSNPYEWDPSRYMPDRAEDKKKNHAFLGWGCGRHPCLGMRFAKLEQNIITAYFIASFDFYLSDKNGNFITNAPRVDFNRHAAYKPANPPYLRVTPKEK